MRRVLVLVLMSVMLGVLAPGAGAATPTCSGGTVGTAKRDVIAGRGGPDRIRGLGGNDFLRGEREVDPGRARDCLNGGPGRDHLIGGFGADTLVGGPGADVIYGEYDYTDALSDGYADRIWGGRGNDRIYPGAGRNVVDAGPGNDFVDAANGEAETVRCGTGRDRVAADFDDRLIGCETVRRLVSPVPHVVPEGGGRFSDFAVRWRSLHGISTAGAGGESGRAFGSEHYEAIVHALRSRTCSQRGAQAATTRSYRRNAVVTLRFRAPRHGWCRGVHHLELRYRYTEDITETGGDSCDTPESGSSQCEDGPPDFLDHNERFARLTFRVG
jgi:hypothetical protein